MIHRVSRKYWPPRKTPYHVNLSQASCASNYRLDFMSFIIYTYNSSSLFHFSHTSNIILNSYCVLLLLPHPFRQAKVGSSVNKFFFRKHAVFRGYIPPAQTKNRIIYRTVNNHTLVAISCI